MSEQYLSEEEYDRMRDLYGKNSAQRFSRPVAKSSRKSGPQPYEILVNGAPFKISGKRVVTKDVHATISKLQSRPFNKGKKFTARVVGEDSLDEGKKMKDDPCWKGYEMIGKKKNKDGREVPNCVPKEDHKPGHDKDDEALDEAPENSVSGGGVDLNKTGKKLKDDDKPMKRTKDVQTESVEKTDPLYKEYAALKKKSAAELKKTWASMSRLSMKGADLGGKADIIADILRQRHGQRRISTLYKL